MFVGSQTVKFGLKQVDKKDQIDTRWKLQGWHFDQ